MPVVAAVAVGVLIPALAAEVVVVVTLEAGVSPTIPLLAAMLAVGVLATTLLMPHLVMLLGECATTMSQTNDEALSPHLDLKWDPFDGQSLPTTTASLFGLPPERGYVVRTG